MDRQVTAEEASDARGIDIEADDLVAEVGQAGRGDEADVAGADDGDAHRASVAESADHRTYWCAQAPLDGGQGLAATLTFCVMRRPQSASGLAAVMASLFVVTLSASPAEAARRPAEASTPPAFSAAGAACTPWTSEYVPPPTIRVLRTERDEVPPEVVGTVQEVDFRDYVATVMAVEWPEHYPLETLKVGAIATRQYAWYQVIRPRGKTVQLPDPDPPPEGQEVEGEPRPGGEIVCYDVVEFDGRPVLLPGEVRRRPGQGARAARS